MSDSPTPPLILTLQLDEASHQYFNQLRQQYFPPERNYLEAHVTLFHHLPGSEQAAIQEQLRALTATQLPLPLRVSGVRFLGQGVAYTLENAQLLPLHRALQQQWAAWLTPQDRQPLRPHVTVQNKVVPATARALHEQLSQEFVSFEATGVGFTLWAYQGGPWQELAQFPFRQQE
jgi:2'-5' RNA ligase